MKFFSNFEDENKDLFDSVMSKENNLVKNDIKFVFDLAYSSFFHIFNTPERGKYIADLTVPQAKKIILWFEKCYLPLYEEFEEFEKCARIKEAMEEIRKAKKLG